MEVSEAALRVLSGLLEARTGQQLSPARRWRVSGALQPLLREHGLAGADALAARLAAGVEPALADETVEALLNNETFFYRDRQLFELLLGPALDRLAHARRDRRRLALWCAGCSTGQEAYSLAMHFLDDPARWGDWRIDIRATDVSAAAIAQAASGVYSQFEVQRGLPVLRMMRWFAEYPGGAWRASATLRGAVRFSVGNLLGGPPPGGPFDVLLCRNVLLYFGDSTRQAAFAALAGAAAPDAVLMLGAGETASGHTGAFVPDPACRGLYVAAPATVAGGRAAS